MILLHAENLSFEKRQLRETMNDNNDSLEVPSSAKIDTLIPTDDTTISVLVIDVSSEFILFLLSTCD
jgi:hypothetical protein